AISTPTYAKTWYRWFAGSIKHQDSDIAFRMLPNDEQKALSAGTDTSGGCLIPPELAATIISVVRERSTVRAGALVVPTTTDQLDLGQFDFAAEWVTETPTAGSETAVAPIKLVSVGVMKARVKAK